MIDTFFLAKFLFFNQPSLNLEMLCHTLGITILSAHRATDDVEATLALFQLLINKFHTLHEEKKQLLYYIFHASRDPHITYLKNYLF